MDSLNPKEIESMYNIRQKPKEQQWIQKLKEGSNVVPKDIEVETTYRDLEGRNPTMDKRLQWTMATGFGTLACLTKLGFAYLGGLVQARKQFIPGFLYFRNYNYNWVGGLQFIAFGYLVGLTISTYTFGQPYLFEDIIRSKFRKHTATAYIDRGQQDFYLRQAINKPHPKDLFVPHEYDE